ncbi:GNAT family N-acetyltransferase [Acuticoccus sp. M5D2P5]|uniref:GNAT family N-acetyltransferase n=1 Tax=Acuticoccus kalidii TaxID=2910977 RepID=UPI001F3C0A8F|nr:GNAT family N-acetyltransferase [Acuticoccus kalidii]
MIPNEFVLAIREPDGGFMGCVGLSMAEVWPEMEFGYWLGRPFWGHGYATEAGRATIAHAFAVIGLTRLTAGYFAGNHRSARVLAKLGFREVGRSRVTPLAVGDEVERVDLVLDRAAGGEPDAPRLRE